MAQAKKKESIKARVKRTYDGAKRKVTEYAGAVKTTVKRTYDGAKRKVTSYADEISRSYDAGYRQGVADHAKYGEAFGSYVSAASGYYRGLKDSKVARRVGKAKR